MQKNAHVCRMMAHPLRFTGAVGVLASCLVLAGCPGASSVLPACELNNTGTITFQNAAGGSYSGGKSLDFYMDGAYVTTVADGGTSSAYTYSAGSHTTITYWAGTSTTNSTSTTASISQCTNLTMTDSN